MQSKSSSIAIFLSAALLCITAYPSLGQNAKDKDNVGQNTKDIEKPSERLKDSDPRPEEIRFRCGPGSTETLGNFLARLNPSRPHTIRVSGACHENISVTRFDRLTLLASTGASINDASGGTQAVVTVAGASKFDFEGFTVNGGGGGGVFICSEYSTCTFSGNVFQGSADDGVRIVRSNAIFIGDVIQNHAGRGLVVVNGGQAALIQATLQANGAAGAAVVSGSNLTAQNTMLQNNAAQGLFVSGHATARLFDCVINGNGATGVRVDSASEVNVADASTTGTSISNNGGFGVRLFDLSFVSFGQGNSVTGNLLGTDVRCEPQFPATRGALTNINGGVTNCVEP